MSNTSNFIQHLRQASPYIQMHRDKTWVIHLPGELMEPSFLPGLVKDFVLLHGLGVRLVLVLGIRPQVDAALAEANIPNQFVDQRRITTYEMLPIIKRIMGQMLLDLQTQFITADAQQTHQIQNITVVSGNWITAQPCGVLEGINYQLTGKLRKIDVTAIQEQLEKENVVLVSTLGHSLTGEIFNLSANDLSQSVAQALKADKWISFAPREKLGDLPAQMSFSKRLQYTQERPILHHIHRELESVNRAHILPLDETDALMAEVFSRDGVGIMLYHSGYDQLRQAEPSDISSIQAILEPLQEKGILVPRPKSALESQIQHYWVMERDGFVMATIALIPYPEGNTAEIAAIAVHSDYRRLGLGQRLVGHMIQTAKNRGYQSVFALTTQTSHWLRQQGFIPSNSQILPPSKRENLNKQRNSQVLWMEIPRD